MYNVFNMGIGFVLAVKEEFLQDVMQELEANNEKGYCIGRVVEGSGVTFNGGAR